MEKGKMKTKVNLSFNPSLNYNKVSIELLDHEIEYEDDMGLKKELRFLFQVLRDECMRQFEEWQKDLEIKRKLEEQRR